MKDQAIAGLVALVLMVSACGGVTDPPPYEGVIEKVSPGGLVIELIIGQDGDVPCIGVRNVASAEEATACGELDLRADLTLDGERYVVERRATRLDSGPSSLGDCVRTDEATLVDGGFVYWCLEG